MYVIGRMIINYLSLPMLVLEETNTNDGKTSLIRFHFRIDVIHSSVKPRFELFAFGGEVVIRNDAK